MVTGLELYYSLSQASGDSMTAALYKVITAGHALSHFSFCVCTAWSILDFSVFQAEIIPPSYM